MSGNHNILVLSDLHLGEALAPTASANIIRDLARAERHLVEFLDKYRRRRADGLPWKLIINGDMVDFLGICILPEKDSSSLPAAPDSDDREYGLGRRRDAACVKVGVVVDPHRSFFRALVRFIAAGNTVEIIVGNHDTEFCWPEVQEKFRHAMGEVWEGLPESSRPGAVDAKAVCGAIGFHPWFYHEPGVVWVEHGHQYDECCSFDYNLHPVDGDGVELITNVDTAAMRYVTNQIPGADPHGTEEWSFGGYLRLASGLGPRGAGRLARAYAHFTRALLSQWRTSRNRAVRRRRRAEHEAALAAMSRKHSLPLATLGELDSMHRRPVVTNLFRLMQVLMLDKILVGLTAILLTVAMLVVLPLSWAALGALGNALAAQLLLHRLDRSRTVDSAIPLQIMPARIIEKIDARFVIMGHSHLPRAEQLAESADMEPRWYFNTGTWMPTGKQGLLRTFTHVVLRRGSRGPTAQLCQWRDGASRAFTPDRTPVLEPRRTPAADERPALPQTVLPPTQEPEVATAA